MLRNLISCIVSLACAWSWAAVEPARCVRVIDGDTVEIERGGAVEVVRLWGVDAPELGQPLGTEAREATAEMVLDRDLELDVLGEEPVVARIRVGDVDIGAALAERGLAWLPEEGGTSERYAAATLVARSSKLGLWSDPQAVHPATWRRLHPVATGERRSPSTLSEMAARVDIGDDTVIVRTGTGGEPPARLSLDLPPTEFGDCVGSHLSGVSGPLGRVRSLVGVTPEPSSDDPRRTQLRADCSELERLYIALIRCDDVMERGERRRYFDADISLGSAVNWYSVACGFAVVPGNRASAVGALATADAHFEEARTHFAAAKEAAED